MFKNNILSDHLVPIFIKHFREMIGLYELSGLQVVNLPLKSTSL